MKRSQFFRAACNTLLIALLCLASCSNQQIDNSATTENESALLPLDGTTGTDTVDLGGLNSPTGETVTTQSSDNFTDVENSNYSKGLSYISLGNGTCAVAGMGSCTDTCVIIPYKNPNGEIVTSISEKAFFGAPNLSAVFLPSSVASIGNMAFAACPSLAYFSVDASNLAYRDVAGVLYTSDGSTIVSYPAAKSASSVTIPQNVRSIADMAFYGCTKLQTVSYSGTLAQWQQISVGAGNNSLIGLNIQYQSSGK